MATLLQAAAAAISGGGQVTVRQGTFELRKAPEPVHVNGLTAKSTEFQVISADGNKTPISERYEIPTKLKDIEGNEFVPTISELQKALRRIGRQLADEAGVTSVVAIQCYNW